MDWEKRKRNIGNGEFVHEVMYVGPRRAAVLIDPNISVYFPDYDPLPDGIIKLDEPTEDEKNNPHFACVVENVAYFDCRIEILNAILKSGKKFSLLEIVGVIFVVTEMQKINPNINLTETTNWVVKDLEAESEQTLPECTASDLLFLVNKAMDRHQHYLGKKRTKKEVKKYDQ